jgi:hypothetical protein
MRFHVDARAVPGPQSVPPLQVRLSGRRPKVGDRVMAIYPELACLQHDEPGKMMGFTERMRCTHPIGAAGWRSGR